MCSLQAVVTELNAFASHYFERKGVESAGKKWEDVGEKMKEAVDLLDSLQGVHCTCLCVYSLAHHVGALARIFRQPDAVLCMLNGAWVEGTHCSYTHFQK